MYINTPIPPDVKTHTNISMLDYDSSFNEYCSYCERRIIDNANGIYCSRECQQKDLYVNTNTSSRRASANFVQTGRYYDPQGSAGRISPIDSQSPVSYHDYSLSAINDNTLPTSLRTSTGSLSPLAFPNTAHQYYKELMKTGKKGKGGSGVSYSPSLALKPFGDSTAYWKKVQSGYP